MAIYGLNFNSTHIPEYVLLKVALNMRLPVEHSTVLTLKGVCNTEAELNSMLLQASRPGRIVEWAKPIQFGGKDWYAVYTT